MKVSVPLPQIPTVGNAPNLEEIREGLRAGIFSPNAQQKRCKTAFWSRYTPGPSTPLPENMTVAFAQELTNSASLKKWWGEPGFQAWFLNQSEAREQVEYLFDRSLEVAEELLNSDTAKAGEKVALIKFLAELAGKIPKAGGNNVERFADADIDKMDENQLKAYLTRKGVLIGSGKDPVPVIDAQIVPNSKEEESK